MNPLTLVALLRDPLFGVGAAAGVVGGLALRFGAHRLGWFSVWAVAASIALAWTGPIERPDQAHPWMVALAAATVGAVAVCTPPLLRGVGTRVPRLLFALSVLGVWGTVPDTEHARVLMGVTAAIGALAWGTPASRRPTPGLVVATAVLMYVVLVDGWPRDSAIVGAAGCIGMLLLAGGITRIRELRARTRDAKPTTRTSFDSGVLVAAQVILVILCGRVAGRAGSALGAALLLLGSFVVVGAMWVGAQRLRDRGAG